MENPNKCPFNDKYGRCQFRGNGGEECMVKNHKKCHRYLYHIKKYNEERK